MRDYYRTLKKNREEMVIDLVQDFPDKENTPSKM